LYAQLGWGGILGAQFELVMGVKLAIASTVVGFLLILPLSWYRFHGKTISDGPIRLLFYLGSFLLVVAALALRIVG
jgi:ABC-type arginine/histidine transport system permease subunit